MSDAVRSLELRFDSPKGPSAVTMRWYPASQARATLLLSHGAGAGQDHPFMTGYAAAIAYRGVSVVTFNFPYTEARRRLPDRNDVLEACARAAVRRVREETPEVAVFGGGKSMGGRILSQVVAAGEPVTGLVFLGYPLHPVGQAARLRTGHWPAITVPCLFVQGSRDTFASPEELERSLPTLGSTARVHLVEAADHSFKVRRSAGRTQEDVDASVQDVVVSWIDGVLSGRQGRREVGGA